MAKTIAMQRGTSSIDSSTPVTMFTQSGGYATKVICNQLVFYYNGNFSYPQFDIALYTSGGARSVLARLYVQSSSYGAWQFMPHSDQINTQVRDSGFTNGANNQTFIGQSSSSSSGTSSYATPSSYAAPVYFFDGAINIPREFYIGPGDSIVAKCSSSATTVGWSFTTITES